MPKPAPESDLLFDLPLDRRSAPAQVESADDAPSEPFEQARLALEARDRDAVEDDILSATAAIRESPPSEALLSARFMASALDLGALAAVLALAVFGAWSLGIDASFSLWPPMVLFLCSFSFLYTVVPLAFWGRTPGMAYTGIVSRGRDNLPLTISQTVLRWLGVWITYMALGLPALVTLSGASISDLLSRSRVVAAAQPNR